MANNKVQLADGTILIDITDTTATTSDVAQGKYFYGADGVKQVGTATATSMTVVETEDSHGGTIVEITGEVVRLGEKTITESGTYLASSDGLSGYSKIVVDVDPRLKFVFEQDQDGYIVISDQEYITSAVGVKF